MSRRNRRHRHHDSPSGTERKRPADNADPQPSPGGPDQPAHETNAGDGAAQRSDTPPPTGGDGQHEQAVESVKAHGWEEAPVKTRQRAFPAPGVIDEPVRIAMTADACAEVTDHAKASLDEEVCGVLLGELCEDDHGTWVLAKAAIRGTSAKQGGAHVTYTQETWAKIYEEKDRKHPRLDIVGWYHSHPGFGVEFSDMDKFIQQNFFSGPAQFALVVDPLGGDEAVCVNVDHGIRYVTRYWIGGKQRKCRVPREEADEADTAAVPAGLDKRLRSVEDRLQQLLQASEEDRSTRHGFLLTMGCLAATACITWIGMTIYRSVWAVPEPPEQVKYLSVPVDIDGEACLLGVQAVRWKIPPKLEAAFLKEQRRGFQEELEKALEEIQQRYEKALQEAVEQQKEQEGTEP